MIQPQEPQINDPNAAIRKALVSKMSPSTLDGHEFYSPSPTTGINGGQPATPDQFPPSPTSGPNTPAPPQPGPAGRGVDSGNATFNPATLPAAPAAPASSAYDRATAPGLWQATGNNVGAQDALLQQWGMGPLSGNGTGVLPTGESIDMRRGARAGDNTAQWMGVGGSGAVGGIGGAGGAMGGAGGASFGTMGSGFQDQIRQQLLAKLQSANSPVDENASEIAQPFAAAQLQADRGQQSERKALAERAYAQGGGTPDQGAITQGVQQSMERNAVGLAGIKSQLIGKVYEGKRQDAQQALQLAVQSGDAEAARQAQMQIAQMNAEIQRLGLSQSQSQWNDKYGLDVNDSQYQRDRDAARAKAGLPF